MNHDTIAAISTGLTESGIGVIRLSGDRAVVIANSIFDGKDLTLVESHTVHYGHIRYQNEILDEVLISVFRAPKTYTREDVVEISCHGGPVVLRDVLDAVLNSGCRPAEPGEFTKRAFLNGRIDLTEAESVMDLISSKTTLSKKISLSQLSGALSNVIHELREEMIHEAAFIEAALDDPEHYDLDGYDDTLYIFVNNWMTKMEDLIDSFHDGELLKNGIRTVIVGKPNVGKSSILNRLTGTEKAIVTHIPGTTRDIIEESISLDGIPLVMIDTAGIRETDDLVEQIGVQKSEEALQSADLVLFVQDLSRDISDEDERILSMLPEDVPCIRLCNKVDLVSDDSSNSSPENVLQEFDLNSKTIFDSNLDSDSVDGSKPMNRFAASIALSVKDDIGFKELKTEIEQLFFSGNLNDTSQVVVNQRQKFELEEALRSLKEVQNTIQLGMTADLYSSDLMDAYRHLGLILGEEVEDDLVDKIFADFCMGK